MIPPSSKQQWAAMLKQVSRRKDAHQGREIHSEIIRAGQDEDILLTSSLLQMYGKCGEVQRARLIFDTIASPDAFTLTMMIAAAADNGQLLQARSCFQTIENPSVVCCNAMLAAYKTSGSTKQACDFFRKLPVKDVATWNTIISANSQHSSKALYLFRSIDLEGLDPNAISFVTALEGCSSIEDVRAIHRRLIDRRLSEEAAEVLKVGNALIGGYGKWSQAEEAENVFERMTIRNVVSWTALITAYAFDLPKALVTFQRMNLCGERPNEVTMISVFQACANAGALALGKLYHGLLKNNSSSNIWMQDLNLGNAIVSFYSKCGEFDRAQAAFQEMQRRDVVSFNVLIAAKAQNDHPLQALRFAKEMRLEGVDPNKTSFTAMFAACNHAGLLEEAVLQLISMKDDFAIDPCVEHYVCVADLLGRGGRIAEAEELILSMPFEADYVAWTILLDACRSHGDLERAERASQQMQLLKPANSSPYVLLFNTRIDETSS